MSELLGFCGSYPYTSFIEGNKELNVIGVVSLFLEAVI